ncbi:DGQHR domain-containing protein [Salinimonas lutimaris]|uniref:DGQHR domain-containing protein n=1 Tax=Salinimonas lutimaris TaxID=914153 RepID=UPI0010C04B17|nr:DGQHR domain-containing protein [Salinimonas lutimaris]
MTNVFEIPAIKFNQPLGTFYVFKMNASDLESVSYSSRAKYKKSGYLNNVFSPITGTQRDLDDRREEEIARFVNSVECAIPNSIVLGANMSEDGRLTKEDERWYATEDDNGVCKVVIPSKKKLASIIDGQHRLAGCLLSDRKNIELLVAAYLDLPLPYQAYLFASINGNQKKVPRSLAYELYGFGSDDEDRVLWSPEKLAVSLVRKLNFDDNIEYITNNKSKLYHKILLGAQYSESDNGFLSLAALVDSILSLITSNPKKDRDVILHYRNKKGRLQLESNHKIPLREEYIKGNDDEIERVIFDFVDVVFDSSRFDKSSYLYKTIGVQSLFSLLKRYLISSSKPFKKTEFESFCFPVWNVDFKNDYFTASGIGRSRITNTLYIATNLISPSDLKNEDDADKIQALINSSR